ncbi:hypothetical protein [Brevundimonas kwangchunensis]
MATTYLRILTQRDRWKAAHRMMRDVLSGYNTAPTAVTIGGMRVLGPSRWLGYREAMGVA